MPIVPGEWFLVGGFYLDFEGQGSWGKLFWGASLPVFPSGESSTHSCSCVNFFSCTKKEREKKIKPKKQDNLFLRFSPPLSHDHTSLENTWN
jgi:hypothetical protein